MIFNRTSNVILLFLSLLAFSACEETVVLELDFESRLVINSFFDSNSPWAVEVSKSANILDDNSNIELVENARVTIYDQNNFKLYELYHLENGVYGNEDKSPFAARGYFVKVEVGAMVSTAYSYVPEKSKLKINNFSVVQEDKTEGIEVDFQIEDKSDLEAYFIWEIINLEAVEIDLSVSNGEKLSDVLINNLQGVSVVSENETREIIDVGIYGDGTYSTIYNTLDGRKGGRSVSGNRITYVDVDVDVEGKNIQAESLIDAGFYDSIILFEPNGGDDDDPPVDLGETTSSEPRFELRVVSISKELFDYYNSIESSRSTSNDSENSQVPIYTNIENGLGVFAGFNESIIRF